MEKEHSENIYWKLEKEFLKTELKRPMRISRYEAGTELKYDVTGVENGNKGKVRVVVDKFVGGGFAGQVYRVKVLDYQSETGPIANLEPGKLLAIKILIPPSAFSQLFRNVVYWIGFQGSFQLQVNPAASRSGALWQKFIRRAAKIRFGDENCIVDIYATFVDSKMGSCGEFSEWIDGRTWRLEVNDHLDYMKRWSRGKKVDEEKVGSPEYRTKHKFMHEFVDLCHKMGAHEFARQYEWTTWKSQPNCLKRKDTEGSPTEGLVGVDFRAGLALLPFLPMSPGDFKLIGKGLARGSLVQFDRGSISKLEKYISKYPEEFADMSQMLEELKVNEEIYRDSLPDITHNHIRLLYSRRLWKTLLNSWVNGWKVRNLVDEKNRQKLQKNIILIVLFNIIGFIPFIGRFIRRLWGQPIWRQHYASLLSSWGYFRRAVRGKLIEKVIGWNRSGRITDERAEKMSKQVWRASTHLPISFLPMGLHRFFTDWEYLKERLFFIAVRPIKLYFDAEMRSEWLREMVSEGRKKHILNDEDAEVILSQVDEPYIQKYLKSLAVHLCTLPITQVVAVIVAIIYVYLHPELPREQSWAVGIGIVALFQVIPISPGSLVRGIYVLYLVIRERNFKDYNIAIFLGFFKYIGYLAFPIQMAYRYPTMARFMAGHWATDFVHIIPVFGESGALMEHRVFGMFYNWPLTIRRKMNERKEYRASLKPKYWHVLPWAIVITGLFICVDYTYDMIYNSIPVLKQIWPLTILIPMVFGGFVTAGAGGASFGKRILAGVICGSLAGILYAYLPSVIGYVENIDVNAMLTNGVWNVFVFSIMATLGVLITEVRMPSPKMLGQV